MWKSKGFSRICIFFCMDMLEYVCVCVLTGYSDWNSYLILLKSQGHKSFEIRIFQFFSVKILDIEFSSNNFYFRKISPLRDHFVCQKYIAPKYSNIFAYN